MSDSIKKEVDKISATDKVNILVEKALKSLDEFRKLNQEQVDKIVAKASIAALNKHGILAKHAVDETGRGLMEDKATKNLFACEHVVNYMRNLKTVGVIEDNDVTGVTYVAEPVGVVCGIVPTTNPTSTAIFKSLICLKTRNPIIFSFHPSAMECSIHAAKIVYEAAVEAGAPKDCIQWIDEASMEATNALMNHDGVATILATGGNAMVRAAYSCGKPALGVGAGNVPAYVEKTANIKQAVHDIVLSKSFDNGMVCASEQAAIVDKEVYDEFNKEMKSYRVYYANNKEKQMLEEFMFGEKAFSKTCGGAKLNANVVGKPASWIAEQAGFKVPKTCSIIACEVSEIGINEPLTREKLSPVLAICKAESFEDGLEKSRLMVEFNGLGHSSGIHTKDKEKVQKFADVVRTMRVLWNQPTTFGGIGDVYNALIPSLTLGCGSYGRNSVGDNVSAIHLLNIKKVTRRRNNMQWFKVPAKIYFERDAIQYLRTMAKVEKVMVITDKAMVKLGIAKRIIDQLEARQNKVIYQLFDDVEPDPDITTVQRGTKLMAGFEPDTIVAVGGGSVMDAAKMMWLFYERPDVDFKDLVEKFMDIRKRAVKFPELGEKAKFVAIPTTSGTGSEVTPFAVISDKKADKKYPVADYSIVPTIAIVDSALIQTVPARVAAASGMDALTHATEAYISIMANDYTDGLCLQAIKLIFDNIVKSVNENDEEARFKMHNAATIAGMAFANAFLGIVHSMSHKIGGKFHTVHGENNTILLPYVIRYNGTRPSKLATWPKYERYKADEKIQDIAKMLGLKADTKEEAVESYANAVFELAKKLNMKTSYKELGIDKKEWLDSIDKLAVDAYEDQCTPCNPRLALIEDMKGIMECAYEGYDKKKFEEGK